MSRSRFSHAEDDDLAPLVLRSIASFELLRREASLADEIL
jgi:hypothetical protein